MLAPGFVKVLRPEICAQMPCNKHVTAHVGDGDQHGAYDTEAYGTEAVDDVAHRYAEPLWTSRDASHGAGQIGEIRRWDWPSADFSAVTMSSTHNLSLPNANFYSKMQTFTA